MKDLIYLIPGTMCDRRLWDPLLELLPNIYRTKYVAIEEKCSKTDMLAEISSSITSSGHILAFSMGGYLALQYRLESAQTPKSLVLIAASASSLPNQEIKIRYETIRWLKSNPYKGMSNRRLKRFVHPSRLNDTELIDTILAMDKKLDKNTLIQQLTATSQRECLINCLSEITCPVLIIGAEDDDMVSLEALHKMYEKFPNSNLKTIPDCGHMLPLEQPQILSKILTKFYKEIDRA
jgi:pimeloyl-ACP methyl ester carboxylesterase